MATHLRIHLGKERELYEQPPLVPAAEQARVFAVPVWADVHLARMLTPANRVGFVLQLGYFQISQRFYVATRYHAAVIHVNLRRTYKAVHRRLLMNFRLLVCLPNAHIPSDVVFMQIYFLIDQYGVANQRIDGLADGHGSGASTVVALAIAGGQSHNIVPHITAGKIGGANGDEIDGPAIIRAALINIGWDDIRLSCFIEVYREIFTDNCRRRHVLHRNSRSTI